MEKCLNPYPLGAYLKEKQLRVSFVSEEKTCGVVLFDKKSGDEKEKITFDEKNRFGNIVCGNVCIENPNEVKYQLFAGEDCFADPYGRCFITGKPYGEEVAEKELFTLILNHEFDWGEDARPRVAYEDALVYCLHVRGFTAHSSSKVKKKGTFAGVISKIPYLKELGVTTLEFQPIYEFIEKEKVKVDLKTSMPLPAKLNYWGYKKGYYYAPKAAYSSVEAADLECKEMIRTLHENGMEAVLQFYFPKEYSCQDILDILRFWVIEYHVDGFHVMGENIPVNDIAKDPLLADTKLWFAGFDEKQIYGYEKKEIVKHLALYDDKYLLDMRKLLKGDENMMASVLYHMRSLPKYAGKINFLSNYYGFTLWDNFSYDYKHNEENGEENRDGSDYNCSWNCGEEGPTRKKKINQMRQQLYKNAVTLLMFSSGTPLIFMGDEFANSARGNNNPYCQDNETTWLNWKDKEKNKELYDYFVNMVQFKKSNKILCPANEYMVMDYKSVGYPDLSYHGGNAWKPQMDSYSRQMGMMFCGKYAGEETFIYMGFNMHWVMHDLALPRLPKGYAWTLDTDTAKQFINTDGVVCTIPPRSISIFIGKAVTGQKNE